MNSSRQYASFDILQDCIRSILKNDLISVFAHFEHASNFGLKFCSYLKNNIVSEYILSIFIMIWSSTMNFTPLSLKMKFLWSSENGWKFNIFALFEHAYFFGLKFCSYFKNNVLSDSIILPHINPFWTANPPLKHANPQFS